MWTCDAAASSSCSARAMPHSAAVLAACSPIERPVRGSALRGTSGTICPGPQPRELLRAPRQRLRPVDVEQDVAQVLVDRDRGVGGRVDPARDPDVDLAQRDLVGDRDHGLQARPARLLDVVGGRLGRELGAQDGLAGEVAVAGMLQDGARDDLAEPLALEREALDEPVERRGQHVLVGRVRVGPVGPREGNPVAADDGDASGVHRCLSPGSSVRINSSAVRSALMPVGGQPPAAQRLGGAEDRDCQRLDGAALRVDRGGHERLHPRAVGVHARGDLAARGERLVVQQAPGLAVGVQEREEGVDAGAQRARGVRRRRHGRDDGLQQRLRGRLHAGQEELFLVAVVVVEQGFRDADRGRDLVHRDVGVAARREQRPRGLEHLPLALRARQPGPHAGTCSCASATTRASPSTASGTPNASTSARTSGRSSAQSWLTALISAFERPPEIRPCSR